MVRIRWQLNKYLKDLRVLPAWLLGRSMSPTEGPASMQAPMSVCLCHVLESARRLEKREQVGNNRWWVRKDNWSKWAGMEAHIGWAVEDSIGHSWNFTTLVRGNFTTFRRGKSKPKFRRAWDDDLDSHIVKHAWPKTHALQKPV